jgi:hypothetical protein
MSSVVRHLAGNLLKSVYVLAEKMDAKMDRKNPFPCKRLEILKKNLPFYQYLPDAELLKFRIFKCYFRRPTDTLHSSKTDLAV